MPSNAVLREAYGAGRCFYMDPNGGVTISAPRLLPPRRQQVKDEGAPRGAPSVFSPRFGPE